MNGEGRKSSLGGALERQFGLPVLILTISSLGIVSIYSASQDVSHSLGWAPLYLKQIAWVVIGGLAFLGMSAYDYHRLSRYAYVLYVLSLLLLVVVFLEGRSTRGAQRWLAIGSFSFQPSEVAKVTLVIMLARYFSTRSSKGMVNRLIIPGILMFPGFLLILLQPDLGTAITYLFVFLTIILFVGPWTRGLTIGVLGILMVLPFLWKGFWMPLRAYQKERILAFLDPTSDPMGKGYQALQSKNCDWIRSAFRARALWCHAESTTVPPGWIHGFRVCSVCRAVGLSWRHRLVVSVLSPVHDDDRSWRARQRFIGLK